MSKRLSFAMLLALGIASFSTTYAEDLPTHWEKDKVYHLTILHTNDHHGHFWPNKNGEYGLPAQKH